MPHWLIKTDPDTWSWQDQQKAGTTDWSGVRNAQAAGFLKQMKAKDRCYFYESGDSKAIVGIVEVVKPWYADPSDASGKFGLVDVKAIRSLKSPVTLAQVKADKALQHLLLVKQSRLSVMPIDDAAWKRIEQMGQSV
jgi:predicted RNA-binding protein with PUA-like domain